MPHISNMESYLTNADNFVCTVMTLCVCGKLSTNPPLCHLDWFIVTIWCYFYVNYEIPSIFVTVMRSLKDHVVELPLKRWQLCPKGRHWHDQKYKLH